MNLVPPPWWAAHITVLSEVSVVPADTLFMPTVNIERTITNTIPSLYFIACFLVIGEIGKIEPRSMPTKRRFTYRKESGQSVLLSKYKRNNTGLPQLDSRATKTSHRCVTCNSWQPIEVDNLLSSDKYRRKTHPSHSDLCYWPLKLFLD